MCYLESWVRCIYCIHHWGHVTQYYILVKASRYGTSGFESIHKFLVVKIPADFVSALNLLDSSFEIRISGKLIHIHDLRRWYRSSDGYSKNYKKDTDNRTLWQKTTREAIDVGFLCDVSDTNSSFFFFLDKSSTASENNDITEKVLFFSSHSIIIYCLLKANCCCFFVRK